MNGEKELYLYLDRQEIGIVGADGMLKELRIPGLSPHKDITRPIAIETSKGIYAPLYHLQKIRIHLAKNRLAILVDRFDANILDISEKRDIKSAG